MKLLVFLVLLPLSLAQWRIIAGPNNGIADTYLLNVAMADENNGFAVGARDTVPNFGHVLRTTDGGRSWTQASYGFNNILFTSAVAQSPSSAIINGLSLPAVGNQVSLQYTTDGQRFNPISGFLGVDWAVGFSFNVASVTGVRGMYAVPGEFLIFLQPLPVPERAQVAITTDGGLTWRSYRTPFDASRPEARVVGGSFPANNVFYLAAGNVPEDAPTLTAENVHELAFNALQRKLGLYGNISAMPVHLAQFRSSLADTLKATARVNTARSLLQGNNGAVGAIWKSTTGGLTWQIQIYTQEYSFQSIECPSTTVCYAVGFAESNQGSPRPGLRIMGTTDGGATWREQLYVADVFERILDLKCASVTECWATGGRSNWDFSAGSFWRTTNGGATWQRSSAPAGVFPGGLSIIRTGNTYAAWATAFNWNTVGSAMLRFN